MKTFKKEEGVSKLSLITTREYAQLIRGAEVTVTVEDARALLDLTKVKSKEKEDICMSREQFEAYEAMRSYLRTIAKTILKISGDATELEDLLAFKMPKEDTTKG